MSYESKIYIVNVTGEGDFRYAHTVAEFDLCDMGQNNGWRNLFREPVDFEIFIDNDNTTNEDKYGDHLKTGELQEIIDWLEKWPDTKTYRRIPPFLAALKAIDPGAWENLKIVHYGY